MLSRSLLRSAAAPLVLLLGALSISSARAADDILLADFEADTYGNWKTTGEAFGPGPARGTLPGQMPVSGFKGERLVNTFFKGDATVGTLTSPPFKIERKYLNFLLGGGAHPGETCINLLLDGKTVRTATGPNDKPGGTEQLDWHTWDVAEFAGKSAVIEIIDKHTGGWGHINVDHLLQSDRKLQAEPARREFLVKSRYLLLPVKTGAKSRVMKFLVDGKPVREFDIEYADEQPSFFAFTDVTPFKGKKLSVEIALASSAADPLKAIAESDEVPQADLYREPLRPQFHFTSRRGWLNDPNGLVYLDGEWHLFYQHNPFGWAWGNMHWGHAVSKDLLRWTELPIALAPPRYGDMAFSGSAVVDEQNTSGFQTGKEQVLVAAFTSTGRGECIVYSNDRGRTWQEFDGNPVVKHAGRDPRLLWHAPTKKWVMALYDEFEQKQWIAFYTSPDLKAWKFTSRIDGFFECPDLFELPIMGTDEKKWVLYAADGKYLLGEFDGEKFLPDAKEKKQLWHGNFYAAQTYSNVPDGRRIQIGWGNGISFPNMPFNQQMTIPCELTLRKTADGVRMFAEPVRELAGLRGASRTNLRGAALQPDGEGRAEGEFGDLVDIRADFKIDKSEALGISLRGLPITYDVKKQELSCRNVVFPLKPIDGRLRLRLLLDRGSLEIFANDGIAAISLAFVPPADNHLLVPFTRGAPTGDWTIEVQSLKSVWGEK